MWQELAQHALPASSSQECPTPPTPSKPSWTASSRAPSEPIPTGSLKHSSTVHQDVQCAHLRMNASNAAPELWLTNHQQAHHSTYSPLLSASRNAPWELSMWMVLVHPALKIAQVATLTWLALAATLTLDSPPTKHVSPGAMSLLQTLLVSSSKSTELAQTAPQTALLAMDLLLLVLHALRDSNLLTALATISPAKLAPKVTLTRPAPRLAYNAPMAVPTVQTQLIATNARAHSLSWTTQTTKLASVPSHAPLDLDSMPLLVKTLPVSHVQQAVYPAQLVLRYANSATPHIVFTRTTVLPKLSMAPSLVIQPVYLQDQAQLTTIVQLAARAVWTPQSVLHANLDLV